MDANAALVLVKLLTVLEVCFISWANAYYRSRDSGWVRAGVSSEMGGATAGGGADEPEADPRARWAREARQRPEPPSGDRPGQDKGSEPPQGPTERRTGAD